MNLGAVLVWGGCVFGWTPQPVLGAIPLIKPGGDTFADFSYLLAVHLLIQSAWGFMSLARENSFRRAAAQLLWVALIFGAMALVYDFGISHRPIPWDYFICGLARGDWRAAAVYALQQLQPPDTADRLGGG